MALRSAVALCAVWAVSGCGVGAVMVVYDGSRQASEKVIGEVLAETSPGINRDQAARCITESLTRREVIALGTGDSTGPSPAYRSKIAEALTRPGVAACLAAVPVQAT